MRKIALADTVLTAARVLPGPIAQQSCQLVCQLLVLTSHDTDHISDLYVYDEIHMPMCAPHAEPLHLHAADEISPPSQVSLCS